MPGRPHVFFLGTSGGLWKTENAGMSWRNVSDGSFASGSIGAVAVAPSDPNVVYAGTGQACLRGNVSAGIGVYRSEDGGKTWTHAGLPDAGQIARIRVHPEDASVLFAAVVGHAFGPNSERGVFRSKNGGRSWEKALFVSPRTGATDLAMDESNPRVLYAAMWTGERKPWTILSGSGESGLYKTVDGGDHWRKLSGGLPEGLVGKIGVAVSPADPARVWALVEAPDDAGGLYRSDDGGETWQLLKTNARRRLFQRTWYYQHVFADPRDANRIYVLNVDSFRSDDGGRSFEEIRNLPHGDAHDLWINPNDTRVLIMGNDGGGTVSLDGGRTWSTQLNQPTAEIYSVTVDGQFPYRVYGASQDNTTFSLPSRYAPAITPFESWRDVGGCESGSIAVDPRDPNVVYAGCGYGGEITRKNVSTGEWHNVMTYAEMEVGLAPRELRYRFNWNAPIRLSPHDPRVLYHCSQFVHVSRDEGRTWQIISPDLSRDEKSKQDYSGAPITHENTGVEVNSNILSFEESPKTAGVLWAGSDDGLVHVSRDGGRTWRDVTPPGLPEWASIQSLEPSPHAPSRVLLAAHRYRLDDRRPFLYATDDYGASWRRLTDGSNGIPPDVPTRVVREDPARRGLLYAGTERGMFVSFDDGGRWQSLQLNLPQVPVTDLRVHRGDLVVSTQGRSFWILDDVTPLASLAAGAARRPRLLQPRDAYRAIAAEISGERQALAENPPYGAILYYALPEGSSGPVRLDIVAEDGRTVASFSSERGPDPGPPQVFAMGARHEGDKRLTARVGLNRFVWDLRLAPVSTVRDAIVWGFTGGPAAAPGKYRATLSAAGGSDTQTFRVFPDPRVPMSAADYQSQLEFGLTARAALDRTYAAVRRCRSIREQAAETVRRLREAGGEIGPLSASADGLSVRLSAIENELMQTKNEADQDVENFPTKLDNRLAYVYGLVAEIDAPPLAGHVERLRDLERELETVLARLAIIVEKDVAEFNSRARAAGAEPILPPSAPELVR